MPVATIHRSSGRCGLRINPNSQPDFTVDPADKLAVSDCPQQCPACESDCQFGARIANCHADSGGGMEELR